MLRVSDSVFCHSGLYHKHIFFSVHWYRRRYHVRVFTPISKGKILPRTRYEGPDWEYMYIPTPLTSTLVGVVGQRHAPTALPRERPGAH